MNDALNERQIAMRRSFHELSSRQQAIRECFTHLLPAVTMGIAALLVSMFFVWVGIAYIVSTVVHVAHSLPLGCAIVSVLALVLLLIARSIPEIGIVAIIGFAFVAWKPAMVIMGPLEPLLFLLFGSVIGTMAAIMTAWKIGSIRRAERAIVSITPTL